MSWLILPKAYDYSNEKLFENFVKFASKGEALKHLHNWSISILDNCETMYTAEQLVEELEFHRNNFNGPKTLKFNNTFYTFFNFGECFIHFGKVHEIFSYLMLHYAVVRKQIK